jgi:uncharacterized protein YdiU (UPF0061 family)
MITFDNTFARTLDGFFLDWPPAPASAPALVFFNPELANDLGLKFDARDRDQLTALFSGQRLPDTARPIAQVYAGHQFGGFSPRLGDGRALLLGEVVSPAGQRFDIAFKGSGRTPYSRGGDGKAALGPMLREVLVSEGLHALGIPTTRSLAVVTTGDSVFRDQVLPGAILTRVASSHLRVGTFQYFAARGEHDQVRQLFDYALARHDPDLAGQPNAARAWFEAVARRQAQLISQWMNVGFIHGVMNTDNMTISGETIDYGPCAFMEAYDPRACFSSIDRQGRYAYANQPGVARWNLARLAEAVLPLLHEDTDHAVTLATEVLDQFPQWVEEALLEGQRAKLGLALTSSANGIVDGAHRAADKTLIEAWLALLQHQQVDYTLAWRHLSDHCDPTIRSNSALHALFSDPLALDAWLERWRERCTEGDLALQHDPAAGADDRSRTMNRVNPLVIPRNHQIEAALAAASVHADFGPFERLLSALREPYGTNDDPAVSEKSFAKPASAAFTDNYRTFCGT